MIALIFSIEEHQLSNPPSREIYIASLPRGGARPALGQSKYFPAPAANGSCHQELGCQFYPHAYIPFSFRGCRIFYNTNPPGLRPRLMAGGSWTHCTVNKKGVGRGGRTIRLSPPRGIRMLYVRPIRAFYLRFPLCHRVFSLHHAPDKIPKLGADAQ